MLDRTGVNLNDFPGGNLSGQPGGKFTEFFHYTAKTYARQMIIRQSNVTHRSLITVCRLTNSSRSDDNPNGFIIEGFTILENKDISTVKR